MKDLKVKVVTRQHTSMTECKLTLVYVMSQTQISSMCEEEKWSAVIEDVGIYTQMSLCTSLMYVHRSFQP